MKTLAHYISNMSPLYDFNIYKGGRCIYTTVRDKTRSRLHVFMNAYGGCDAIIYYKDGIFNYCIVS